MLSRASEHKSDVIDAAVAQLYERLTKDDAGHLEGFIRQYYNDVAPEDLTGFSADTLYGEALSMWRFAQKRKPGIPKIRVYNPRQEDHGWQSTHTIIEIVNDNMPFLVDSVSAGLNRQQLGTGVGSALTVHLLIHPILRVRRDKAGNLLSVIDDDAAPVKGEISESLLHIEVSQQSSKVVLKTILESLDQVLEDVRAAVEDWPATIAKINQIIDAISADPPPLPAAEVEESKAFLAWIRDDNFTFLGYREYHLERGDDGDYLRLDEASGLGVLRNVFPESRIRSNTALTPAVSRFARRKQLLIITKANTRATVHRPVYMDYIGVKIFDGRGRVVGERRFLGLFTSAAYNRNPRDIPMLRDKVATVLARSPFPESSHNGKALQNILESYPRDELFQIDADELYQISHGILHLEERQRIRLFLRRDDYARFFSCLIYVPRERYNTELRRRMEAVLLKSLNGTSAEYTVQLSEAVMARIHFIVHTPYRTTDAGHADGDNVRGRRGEDTDAIEARLVETARLWTDDLRQASIEQWGEGDGLALYSRFQEAFPSSYQELFGANSAVDDIVKIEELSGPDDIAMKLYVRIDAPEGLLHFKVYRPGDPVPLSDILPMLENMGLKVIEEASYRIACSGDLEGVWIHDFSMISRRGVEFDAVGVKEAFQDCFAKVWSGEVEDDGFNGLVIAAGMTWREVAILRAYCKYRLQAWKAFSQPYMEETCARHPDITRRLIELFMARFDPSRESGRAAAVNSLDQKIAAAIDAIDSLDEDRILRRFHLLIRATLRTNYFQSAEDGGPKPYISFKLDSQAIDDLPLPRPWVEIFVYSPRVEAVHLRGGSVARGGLRWSDRREDFRTEVLGLMKAQMVKNAVIVPVGAKGGFVVKRPPAEGGREALMEEVVACYKTLIRGLLDITDNLVAGAVAPPPDVVRHDADDPYLVVAADKGTATFSDIANEVAMDYGFWLGDAFASGGSVGYDHKKMGITARGAWESVKRHFRELDMDIQTTDFTCIGIGDMSGDVFGNGMLLSKHIRLIGAFNHLHIFFDPEADAEKGYAERRRLFALPRSSWNDYDAKLISKGGGVYERRVKSIKVTPPMKSVLGVEGEQVTPSELIRAMLVAEVDLLWNGGIGTYVKASGESHAEVGDRANDGLRVDGRELRCRVVGEGGNLGLTQGGRIEYALHGGHIYTDAIDNSAGVDCSDHEVNIKILLGDVMADGDMTAKQRVRILAEMTDEVGALVLLDNYRQTQAINVALAQGVGLLEGQARLMRELERAGELNRALEGLPDDETLEERRKAGEGLTGPEFSVLFAYSKMTLYQTLLASDLPEDPYLALDLTRYFPEPMRERFQSVIHRHRLRREIIATSVTNSMVNRVGAAFISQFNEAHGFAPSETARAYAITRDCYGLRTLWAAIEALDNKVAASVQTAMLIDVGRLVERCTLWFLRNRPQPLDITAAIDAFAPGIDILARDLKKLISPSRAEIVAQAVAEYTGQGVPKALARQVASLGVLVSALDIVETARANKLAVEAVAGVYFDLGDRLGLEWLRNSARGFAADSHWQHQAVAAIIDDLYGEQRVLTGAVLAAKGRTAVSGAVDKWLAANRSPVERNRRLIDDLRKADIQDLAMLTVANRQIRVLAAG